MIVLNKAPVKILCPVQAQLQLFSSSDDDFLSSDFRDLDGTFGRNGEVLAFVGLPVFARCSFSFDDFKPIWATIGLLTSFSTFSSVPHSAVSLKS